MVAPLIKGGSAERCASKWEHIGSGYTVRVTVAIQSRTPHFTHKLQCAVCTKFTVFDNFFTIG